MSERLRTEGHVVQWDDFENHIVICGWNSKATIILEEFRAAQANDTSPIVVIAQLEEEPIVLDPTLRRRIRYLKDDFTKISVLQQAGIERARICVILADRTENRTEQDADARTILAALTVEKLHPSIYTCAEILNRQYGSHLEMGHVNDYVVSGEHSAFLLAQAALNRGLMGVFTELLTHQHGNQFYRVPIPDSWVGRDFLDLFTELKREHKSILVAIYSGNRDFLVNPDSYVFKAGDHAVLIAQKAPDFKDVQVLG